MKILRTFRCFALRFLIVPLLFLWFRMFCFFRTSLPQLPLCLPKARNLAVRRCPQATALFWVQFQVCHWVGATAASWPWKGPATCWMFSLGKRGVLQRFKALSHTYSTFSILEYRIIKKRLIYIPHIRLTSYFTDMTSDCTYTHDIIVGAFCYFLIFVTVFLVVTYDIVSGVTWKHVLTTCCFIIVNYVVVNYIWFHVVV